MVFSVNESFLTMQIFVNLHNLKIPLSTLSLFLVFARADQRKHDSGFSGEQILQRVGDEKSHWRFV